MKNQRRVPKSRSKRTEVEIDEIVAAEVGEDQAWGRVISVRRGKSTPMSLPTELAARAAFLAKLHRESGLEKWVERVVRERVEIEESAFAEAKRTLAS